MRTGLGCHPFHFLQFTGKSIKKEKVIPMSMIVVPICLPFLDTTNAIINGRRLIFRVETLNSRDKWPRRKRGIFSRFLSGNDYRKGVLRAGELCDCVCLRHEAVRLLLSRHAGAALEIRVTGMDRVRDRGGDFGSARRRRDQF